jgi:hypothetical protein
MLKTVSSITNAVGALNYKGTWDASTNNPTLVSSVGVKGDYYVVSVAGNTNLNGTTLWGVGDMAVFNGSIWQKIDGGDTSIVTALTVTGLTGYMYANNTSPVTASLTIPNAGLTNSNVTYNGVTVALGGSGTITAANPSALTISTGLSGTSYDGSANVTIAIANTTVTAASYGSANTVSTFTVNQQGQLTAAGNSTISIAPSQINAVIPNDKLQNSSITLGNTTLTLGGTTTNVGNLTLANVTINTGSVNASITSNNVNLTSTTNANATFATASLPLVPEGYVTVQIGGVNKKIPYYGV